MWVSTQQEEKTVTKSNVPRKRSDKNQQGITLRGISDAERQQLRIPSYHYILP